MLYLLIKELKPSADIVFIVTASLNKDMTGSNDNFRSNALRVMCQITDSQMLLQVERFIKQACVDKQAAVSSAALVSGLQLLKKNNDSVKRWQNEVIPCVRW
jgi:coatomer protein complex subunit gamma